MMFATVVIYTIFLRLLAAQEPYDFIVVGAGSSGSVVASRLGSAGFSVVLFEAGPPMHPLAYDPDTSRILNDEELNPDYYDVHWDFRNHSAGYLNGRLVEDYRAKMLGGCSSHNEMFYGRGIPADYDEWANLTEDSGWEYSALAQHFENMEAKMGVTVAPFNGFGVSLVKSCTALNIPFKQTYNSGLAMDGVYPTYSTISDDYVRQNSYTRYIEQTDGHNVHVRTGCEVQRVIFNGRMATGVEVECEGQPVQQIQAQKEIILSAGVFESPILLWKSGIGDRYVVEEQLNSPLVSNLPGVGQNLQGALIYATVWSISQSVPRHGKNGTPVVWILPNEKGQPIAAIHTAAEGNMAQLMGGLVESLSIGEMYIDSASKEWKVDQRWLHDRHDVQVALDTFKVIESLAHETSASGGLGDWITSRVSPGPEVDTSNPEELETWIKEAAGSFSHPVGTCKMGKLDDVNAVVNSELNVIGVEGLRVVDASIMPTLPNVHTQGPSFLIGEKGAELILNKYNTVNSHGSKKIL